MAHGILARPAPARRICSKATDLLERLQKELVTPLVLPSSRLFAIRSVPTAMSVTAIGYGGGHRRLDGQPNVVRIMIGEAAEKTVAGFDEEIAVIGANLDDMNRKSTATSWKKALAAGALDVYTTPGR